MEISHHGKWPMLSDRFILSIVVSEWRKYSSSPTSSLLNPFEAKESVFLQRIYWRKSLPGQFHKDFIAALTRHSFETSSSVECARNVVLIIDEWRSWVHMEKSTSEKASKSTNTSWIQTSTLWRDQWSIRCGLLGNQSKTERNLMTKRRISCGHSTFSSTEEERKIRHWFKDIDWAFVDSKVIHNKVAIQIYSNPDQYLHSF